MNIIDILIQLVTYLMQNFLLPILPTEMSFYTLADLQADLGAVEAVVIGTFGGWGVLFPILTAILLLTCVAFAEIYLLGFKIVKYGIEIFAKK